MTRGLFDLAPETVESVPNPLVARDPTLVAEFEAFRLVVADHLLNALVYRDRRPEGPEPPHSVEDAKAVAIVLRILARLQWSRRDLAEFAAYWRTAWQSQLFGYEFEAVRHRVQHGVAEAEDLFPERGRDL